jgi:FMN reductase
MRPLFGFFQALTIPVAFFASAGDFDGTTLLNPRVFGRIETGLGDVADLLRARAAPAPALGAGPDSPTIRRTAMPTDIHPREKGT